MQVVMKSHQKYEKAEVAYEYVDATRSSTMQLLSLRISFDRIGCDLTLFFTLGKNKRPHCAKNKA